MTSWREQRTEPITLMDPETPPSASIARPLPSPSPTSPHMLSVLNGRFDGGVDGGEAAPMMRSHEGIAPVAQRRRRTGAAARAGGLSRSYCQPRTTSSFERQMGVVEVQQHCSTEAARGRESTGLAVRVSCACAGHD